MRRSQPELRRRNNGTPPTWRFSQFAYHKPRVRKLMVTLTIAVVAAACSKDHHGGTGGSGGGVGGAGGTGGLDPGEPLAKFGSDFETAFCTPRVACGAFNDLATC